MRKQKPDTTPPGHRCPECGTLVRPGPFEPAKPTRRWVRCEPCRLAGPQVIALALARAGIEDDPGDPAVIAGLATVPWRARIIESARVTREAERIAGPQGILPANAYADLVHRATFGLDTVGTPSNEPWDHLDPRAIRKAIARARRDLAGAHQPRRCTGGPCGCCGVALAPTWPLSVRLPARSGLGTGRSTTWPVCGACEPILAGAGGDPTSDRARRAWTALVLDRPADPPPMSVPALVRCYAEFVGPDTDPHGAAGCEAPWGFVSTADRDVIATRAPQHRAPEVLDRERRIAMTRARIEAARASRGPRSALAGGDRR